MANELILATAPLGMHWPTLDPFLFCAYHKDAYPCGNTNMGISRELLGGRDIGADFSGKDGWSMYHGNEVPGFPRHPHRGFETVTLARSGFIDHSDSLGATARFGEGDVQWMTAGRGIVHSEMFPLLQSEADNPAELFQIWLNLPAANKMVAPHFSMLWSNTIPRVSPSDSSGVELALIAGGLDGVMPPAPPPDSWASDPRSELCIWTVKLDSAARWRLPRGASDLSRVLYFFGGTQLRVNGEPIDEGQAVQLVPDADIRVENDSSPAELLLLQGRPIGEPVAQHGPFVMNTQAEIQQAMRDYHDTGFGGWPWTSDGPVHPRSEGRQARYPDGSLVTPTVSK